MTNKKMATINMVAVLVGLASPAAALTSAHAATTNNTIVTKWDVPNPISVDKNMKELSGSEFKIQVFTRENTDDKTTWVEKQADKQKNDDGTPISMEDQAQSIIGAPTTVDAKDSKNALTKIVYTENKAVDGYQLFKDSITLYETTNGWVQDTTVPTNDNVEYKAVDDKLTHVETIDSVDMNDESINKTNTLDFKEEPLATETDNASNNKDNQTTNETPSTTNSDSDSTSVDNNSSNDSDTTVDNSSASGNEATAENTDETTSTSDNSARTLKAPLSMHYKAAATIKSADNTSMHISGTVFYDYNKNGVNDSNDAPAVSNNIVLKNVQIDANGNIKQVFNTYYAKTDSSGKYTFKDLDSGTYIVTADTSNTTGYTLIWHETNLDANKDKFAVVVLSNDGSDSYDNVNFGLGKTSNASTSGNNNSNPKGTTPAVVTIPDTKNNTSKNNTAKNNNSSSSSKTTVAPKTAAPTTTSNTSNSVLPNTNTTDSSVSPYTTNNGSSSNVGSNNSGNNSNNSDTRVDTGELNDSTNTLAVASGAGIMGIGGMLLGKSFRRKKK